MGYRPLSGKKRTGTLTGYPDSRLEVSDAALFCCGACTIRVSLSADLLNDFLRFNNLDIVELTESKWGIILMF
jgi:hypothetical protein